MPGVQTHALRQTSAPSANAEASSAVRAGRRLPRNAQRLVNLVRYRRAGLPQLVASIRPDVLHGHYLVEHGFYATSANFHPYVVSAWGSDVLVEPGESRISRQIARFTLGRADLATANNRHMAREMVIDLGVDRGHLQHIVLGVPRRFLDDLGTSVNLQPNDAPPTILSTRSLDTPLYNIEATLRAMSEVLARVPDAQLLIAGDGRRRPQLEALAKELKLDASVAFIGSVPERVLGDLMTSAQVFVSTPSSDATSVAVLQAMAAGCFPIVSHLPSQQELVSNAEQGLRVVPGDEVALAAAIVSALQDPERRRRTAERNRPFVEDYGLLETNMARMEAWYYRLANRTDEYQP
jgi:glycosyltransferase involved in cell wall biosynthesis